MFICTYVYMHVYTHTYILIFPYVSPHTTICVRIHPREYFTNARMLLCTYTCVICMSNGFTKFITNRVLYPPVILLQSMTYTYLTLGS